MAADRLSAFKRILLFDPDPRYDSEERRSIANDRLLEAFRKVGEAMRDMNSDDWDDDPF